MEKIPAGDTVHSLRLLIPWKEAAAVAAAAG